MDGLRDELLRLSAEPADKGSEPALAPGSSAALLLGLPSNPQHRRLTMVANRQQRRPASAAWRDGRLVAAERPVAQHHPVPARGEGDGLLRRRGGGAGGCRRPGLPAPDEADLPIPPNISSYLLISR